ncbi:MAG: DUF58 domain-containing protein [Ruminococcaceae bacterium]|nr:DUF58 domain-containing protein [Oscillospiraceae bacterium]
MGLFSINEALSDHLALFESAAGTAVADTLEKIGDFLTSPAFKAILIVLGVLLVLFILLKIYGAMRASRLYRIEYERTFTETGVYEGEEVEMVETIRNTGFFPLLMVDIESYFFNELDLHEYEPDPGSTMQYVISRFNLWPYMQIKRHHKLTAKQRGHYKLQVATIYAKKAPIPLEAPAELYVYPKAIPLNLQNMAVGRMQGEFVSFRPLYTDPFSLAGIRDYRFGDPVSQINFKASARVPMTGFNASPLKVNARDYCASRRLMIYMDFHLAMGSKIDGKEYNRRAERGLSFCAALVRDAVYGGFAVGFAANCKTMDGEMSTRFDCDSSNAHLVDILKEMAKMNPTDGASFASLLERDIREGMRDTEIIIISFGTHEEVLDRIDTLEQFGNSVQTIILEDAGEDSYGG